MRVSEMRNEDHDISRSIDNVVRKIKDDHDLTASLEKFDYRLSRLTIEFHKMKKELRLQNNNLRHANNDLQEDHHKYLSFVSLGMDIRDIPLRRYISVRIYLSESKRINLAIKALDEILNSLDLSVSDDYPAEIGSYWKRWIVNTKDLATQPQVAERLQKVERALELQGLHKLQSEVDKNEAEAASTLISALDKVSSAAIQVGSLIIIKLTDSKGNPSIQARTLSPPEMIFLERNQDLLKAPNGILNNLAAFNRNELANGDDNVSTLAQTPDNVSVQ
jgi:hypothetical protein